MTGRQGIRGALSGQREIVWVLRTLWGLGLAVMLAETLLASEPVYNVGVSRALLMVSIGAGMSAMLWHLVQQRDASPTRRTVMLCVGASLAVVIHIVVDVAAKELLHHLFGNEVRTIRRIVIVDRPVRTFVLRVLVETDAALYAALHGFFAISAAALSSLMETRKREQMLVEARAATTIAQLTLLRHQINPHFVFNTLNAIGSLVESARNSEAGAMIEKLSEFLRSSLQSQNPIYARLEEELSVVEAYLDIEAVRFGERLQVQYDVDPDVGQQLVPSFILQPLVENAIKHAVAGAMHSVQLRVSARRQESGLLLQVEDDGAGRGLGRTAPRHVGAGVGLANVRQRLSLLYGEAGVLSARPTKRGFMATIHLPLSPELELVAG